MAINVRTFSDLDLNFLSHPVTGDVTRKFDDSAIKQSIRNLLLTKNFERPFHSDIGSPIQRLLFEPFSPLITATIKRAIENTITNFEPRVNVRDVQVALTPDENSLAVNIIFTIINTTDPISVKLLLERTR